MIQKRDPFKKEYEPYKGFKGMCLSSAIICQVVACANCGKNVTYEDPYTSRFIHSDYGFGYAVCPACYKNELLTEAKAMGK